MASRFSVEAVFKAIDKFTAPVTLMQNRVGKFTRSMEANLKSVDRVINKTASSLYGMGKTGLKIAAAGVVGLVAAITGLSLEFSKVEDATAAFTPLMGGVDKAKKLVDALNQAAADTPFQFETLSDTAKQLLPVMNGDINRIVGTIKMLGDTAGGNAQKLDSITRGFTKAMLKGKVDLESLNMIGEAGVPIFTALADSMGKKVNPAFFKMISAGKVTTAQLTKAFEKMTSKGGMFFEGMEIASKTTSGMWSTLMDNISLTAAAIGEVLAPTIKELIQGATDIAQRLRAWVEANKDFIRSKFIEYVTKAREVFGRLIDKFSDTNKASSMLDSLVNVLLSVAKAIDWLFEHGAQLVKFGEWVLITVVALKALAVIMAIVNAVMLANPIGLIVVAIGLLIAAVAALIIYWDELMEAFDTAPGWMQVGISSWPIVGALLGAIKLVKDLGGAWDWIKGKFGMDVTSGEGTPAGTATPQVVSPQDRTAQAVNDFRASGTAELLIKDSTGRAQLTETGKNAGFNFNLLNTGSF